MLQALFSPYFMLCAYCQLTCFESFDFLGVTIPGTQDEVNLSEHSGCILILQSTEKLCMHQIKVMNHDIKIGTPLHFITCFPNLTFLLHYSQQNQ